MARIADAGFDAGLAYVIANGNVLTLCSAEPTSFGQVATYGLAEDTDVTCGAPADGAVSGRKTTVPASVCVGIAGGNAAFWALHDGAAILVATGPLQSTVAITIGINYDVEAFDIGIEDATAVA